LGAEDLFDFGGGSTNCGAYFPGKVGNFIEFVLTFPEFWGRLRMQKLYHFVHFAIQIPSNPAPTVPWGIFALSFFLLFVQ
jgi:hypothetical protein